MARKNVTKPAVPVDAITHKDARTNIPTRELAGFAADDEAAPQTVLYPRDPSLDPQLVWKGKDEQDRKPLEAPAVPVYIQEKIHPLALVEELRRRAGRRQAAAAAEPLRRLQRAGRLRKEGGLLPPRAALEQPHHPRRQPARHDQPGREGEPYDKLKRALRAEIDEAEWAKLYATKSLPFEAPAGGRIAVKVINHYGDEVLKVFKV